MKILSNDKMYTSLPLGTPYYDVTILTELATTWANITVPLYASIPNTLSDYAVFGSGFLVTYEDRRYLVTAKHVVDEIQRAGLVGINVAGKGAVADNLIFKVSKRHDLAIAQITNYWIRNNKLSKVVCIPLVREESWSRTEVFLLAGYPASRNRLQPAYDKTDLRYFCISALPHSKEISSSIVDSISFGYDEKKIVNSALINPGGKPPLHGMSGGPALRVIVNPKSRRISVEVAGVLCEWKKGERAIVAAPVSAIFELIEALPKMPENFSK